MRDSLLATLAIFGALFIVGVIHFLCNRLQSWQTQRNEIYAEHVVRFENSSDINTIDHV